MNIEETRKLKIKERVITLENILSLAKILDNEKLALTDYKDTRLVFNASCTDDASFSSQEVKLFQQDSPISKKRVNSIDLKFTNYQTKSAIVISLAHGNSSSTFNNFVQISGTDSNWVNGTLKTIEETINSFSPQNTFFQENEKKVKVVFALGLGSLYMLVTGLIQTTPSSQPSPDWVNSLNHTLSIIPFGYYLLKYSIAYIVGWLPSDILYEKLKVWWPSVELQIGPEHTFIEKQRRKWILNTILLGVVPLITSLIYDIIKLITKASG